MPAVTVENILILPRVPEPDVTAAERKVTPVTTAPAGLEGEGFPVRRRAHASYSIAGTFRDQDSNGGGGLITDGDTQWMTAGGGILHIEAPPEALVASGGLFHGFQLWVN